MGAKGFLSPNTAAMTDVICRRIVYPNDPLWKAIIAGIVSELTYEYNYQQFGTLTPDECATLGTEIYHAFLDSTCMIGAIFPYATSAPPTNCLPCDGSTYQRVDYPALYAALDPAYITDADTFTTPNLSDLFVMASGTTYPANSIGGADTVSLTANQNGQHSHTTQPHTHTNSPHTHTEVTAIVSTAMEPVPVPVPAAIPGAGVTGPSSVIIDTATVTVDNSGTGEAHENKPPFLSLNYCIVAK